MIAEVDLMPVFDSDSITDFSAEKMFRTRRP